MEVHFNGNVIPISEKDRGTYLQHLVQINQWTMEIKASLMAFPEELYGESPPEITYILLAEKTGLPYDIGVLNWICEKSLFTHIYREGSYTNDELLLMAWEDDDKEIKVGPDYKEDGGW